MSNNSKKQKGFGRFLNSFFIVFGLIVSGVVYTIVANVETYSVPSQSMIPTILPEDHILALTMKISRVKRGEVILFQKEESLWIKRAAALSGDIIEFKKGNVILNGNPVEEPYLSPLTFDSSSLPPPDFGPLTIPQGTVFVLGDNRDHSNDSRFFGPIPESDVFGKALFIYWSKDLGRIGKRIQ